MLRLLAGVYSLFRRWQRAGVWQRIVTRYDKLAVRYETTILIAALNDWLTCL
ncbi:hypothetical protein ACFQ08_19375 [Streptosporangium algeriense]|uniref:Transposase DDE domain-containing protein n=1 Tax=Streptosporangium algeriense TaxID=1682748 RepID=A0ABW3DS73_9ACTN